MKYLILLLFAVIYSCNSSTVTEDVRFAEFEFSVYNNEPIFEDEYLYDKISKNCLIEKVDEIDIYHIDWNNNSNFKEIGIDYIGIKSELEYKPAIVKIDTSNGIRLNGISHKLKFQDNYMNFNPAADTIVSELNLLTELTPIILENGKPFYPEIKHDSTVLYFWATWCRPCIETLKKIDVKKLSTNGIKLIPIAYKCSDSTEFLKENNLNFEDLIISEKSAKVYNIKSLSKQYTFLKNKEVSDNNVNLKEYYH